MSQRYEVTFIERVARKTTVTVDFPCRVPVQEVYHSARRMVVEQARQRENDPWYYPDLQTIGTNYLGGTDDAKDSAAERESSEQADEAGKLGTDIQPSIDRAEPQAGEP